MPTTVTVYASLSPSGGLAFGVNPGQGFCLEGLERHPMLVYAGEIANWLSRGSVEDEGLDGFMAWMESNGWDPMLDGVDNFPTGLDIAKTFLCNIPAQPGRCVEFEVTF